MTILDKAPPRLHHSDEPEPEHYERSSVTLASLQRQDNADFGSGVLSSSFGVPARYGNSPGDDLERQEHSHSSPVSPEMQQGRECESADADPALGFGHADANVVGLQSYKGALDSGKDRTSDGGLSGRSSIPEPLKAVDPKSSQTQPTPSLCHELPTTGLFSNAEQVAQVIKLLETLGYKIEKDTGAQEWQKPDSQMPTAELSMAEPSALQPALKNGLLTCDVCFKYKGRPSQMKYVGFRMHLFQC